MDCLSVVRTKDNNVKTCSCRSNILEMARVTVVKYQAVVLLHSVNLSYLASGVKA